MQTATYTFQDTAELIAYQEGRYGSYEYGRYGNPTTRACEEKIRELEGAEDCLVSSSGMNAATTMLLALVPAGGHIVTTTDCYRRTRQVGGGALPLAQCWSRRRPCRRGAAASVYTRGGSRMLQTSSASARCSAEPQTHWHKRAKRSNACMQPSHHTSLRPPHPALPQFIQTVLPKMGISATVIDPADLGALERALEEHDVRDGWARCVAGGLAAGGAGRALWLLPAADCSCAAALLSLGR